jgi:hypothetical protein
MHHVMCHRMGHAAFVSQLPQGQKENSCNTYLRGKCLVNVSDFLILLHPPLQNAGKPGKLPLGKVPLRSKPGRWLA